MAPEGWCPWPWLTAYLCGKWKAPAGWGALLSVPSLAEAGALLRLSFPSFSSGGSLLATLGGCSFGMVFFSVQRRRWEGGGPGVLAPLSLHVGTLSRELGVLGPCWQLKHLPSPALRPRLDLRWHQHLRLWLRDRPRVRVPEARCHMPFSPGHAPILWGGWAELLLSWSVSPPGTQGQPTQPSREAFVALSVTAHVRGSPGLRGRAPRHFAQETWCWGQGWSFWRVGPALEVLP